jgi:hypothetical protein
VPALAARFCQDLLTDPYASLRADQIKIDMFRHEIVRLILDNQRVESAGRGFGGAWMDLRRRAPNALRHLSRKWKRPCCARLSRL